MQRQLFSYELPPELIAQEALAQRSGARLLHVPPGDAPFQDRAVMELPQLLHPGDLLVFNDTRVIPARLYARKPSGGAVEIMVERLLDAHSARVQLRASKTPAPGSALLLEDGSQLTLLRREPPFHVLHSEQPWLALLDRLGHVPLPPYIERADRLDDRERYQTLHATRPGAVAAPTAGLHFDAALLAALAAHGVERTVLTLHVGAGTFKPIQVDDLAQHRMHAEWIEVDAAAVAAVARTRARGGRVVAVGTTALRALESAALAGGGILQPFRGDTELFVRPGFEFRVVDGLFTNFHQSGTTLLVLVSALAGRERILAAYHHAIERRYRFFSYGDACLLWRAPVESAAP